MLSLHPTWAATPGVVMCSNSIPPCSWSLKTSHKPILDGPMSLKPNLILWKTPDALPQQEFSWKGVISFIELTSVAYSWSSDAWIMCNNIMQKAYAIFLSKPGHQFIFALSIANPEFHVHMFDHSGVVHSCPYNIHQSPHPLICMLAMLAFSDPQDIQYSVLKSSPRTRKKPATKLDCNQFGPDHSCGPEGFEISPVVLAEAWVKLKDWLWTGCNQSFEGPVAGLGLMINYSKTPCIEHFKGVLEMRKTWVLNMRA